MKTYVLYNAQSNNGQGKQAAKRLETVWKDRALTYMEARQLDDYAGFFTKLAPGDTVCVCGGDGTLNYLVNHVDCDRLTHIRLSPDNPHFTLGEQKDLVPRNPKVSQ